jgi:tannase/feruloyl esterase
MAGVVCATGLCGAAMAAAPLEPGAGAPAAQTSTSAQACGQLTSLKLPDIRITDAVVVPAATTGTVRAAHCRVDGIVGTEIRFTLLLPDQWNGKFFMGGGGGFVGSIQNSAQTTVNDGYATVGTDTGHQGNGTDASWALNNLERQVNFGYLAVHRTAEAAKSIIAGYYGRAASRNYFSGCSRGGGQAFMEAQRFPNDFDGIIAGAPAFDWTGLAAQNVSNAQAVFPDPRKLGTPMFTLDELKLVESNILDACDASDGVKDGVIDDPRQCRFDVNTLPLSEAKKAALKKIYAPTKNGEGEIYPPQPFGGEGQLAGWPAWIAGGGPAGPNGPTLRFAFGTQIFKFLVFNDPDWDYSRYELSRWKQDSALAASYLNATNPDLSVFKAHGGKLLLWHGWADAALTPLASIRYHEQVYARDSGAADYFRTFMLPGVLHCAGGNGPDTVDWPSVLADWVEKGRAPDRVVAKKIVNGAPTRSRPLCPYPQKAVYSGSGSTDDEQNFVCRRPN